MDRLCFFSNRFRSPKGMIQVPSSIPGLPRATTDGDTFTRNSSVKSIFFISTVIRLQAGEGTAMLIVTHKMEVAREMGTRVLFMDKGRILEDDGPHASSRVPRASAVPCLDLPGIDVIQPFL
jgi:hypothetical protein